MLNSLNKRPKPCNRLFGASLTWMSLALILALTSFAGCARNKLVVHPLEKDFRSVKMGQTVTAEKDSFLVTSYWLSEVAGMEVET